jgi:serine/threonine protein kinase
MLQRLALSGDSDLSVCQSGYPDLEFLAPIKLSRQRGVYRAVSKKYGTCIVKTTSSTATQVEVDLVRNEYSKLRMCKSDNIVSAYDIYEHQSSLGVAILTEECGQSLAKRQTSQLSLETVLEIGIQIAQGLDVLHRNARLIHSDINPNNVCYDEANKRVCIIDLGSSHGFMEPFTSL